MLPFGSGVKTTTANAKGKEKLSANHSSDVDGENDPNIVVEHYENAKEYPGRPLSKRQRLRFHCGRFWICYLIGTIVVMAISMPVFFLKILPAIVQKMIDQADFPIINARIGAASSKELGFALTTVFTIPGGFSARMDPYGIAMYNAFTPGYYPYTYAEMPESALHLKGATSISINATSPVLNATEVAKWINVTLNAPNTTLSMRASTMLHLGALKIPIKINKDVTLAALNKMNGFGLDYMQIVIPAEPDGTNMIGNMTIPNTSAMDFDLGVLKYNASVAGIKIANLSVNNALLTRGNNTLPFRGQVFLDTVYNNLGTIFGNSSTLNGGNFNMVVQDGQCIIKGEHIPWVESVLATSPLMASVPLTQLLQNALSSALGPGTPAPPPPRKRTDNAVEDAVGEDGFDTETVNRWTSSGPNGASEMVKAARLYQKLIELTSGTGDG